MWDGLLPIGSVVSLHGSEKRLLILGSCVVMESDVRKVFDYVACLFPEGFKDPDEMIMFDREGIDKIYCVGYLSPEGEEFRKKSEGYIRGLRDGSLSFDSKE